MKPPDSVIDLYAASAQVESQTRSENIKFGIQNRMRSGKTILNYIQFLSYTKGLHPGKRRPEDKKYLESHGIKTVTGKTERSTSTIDRMLNCAIGF